MIKLKVNIIKSKKEAHVVIHVADVPHLAWIQHWQVILASHWSIILILASHWQRRQQQVVRVLRGQCNSSEIP